MNVPTLTKAMRLGFAALGGLAVISLAGLANAGNYPEKPIKMIVPFGAGGGTDTLTRTLKPYLEAELGVDLVIINVPGAGSVKGSRRALGEAADGYNLLINHTTLLTNIAMKKADFATSDFDIAGGATEIPLVVVVPSTSKANNLADLFTALAGSDPVIAGVNLGAVNHFAMLMVEAGSGGGKFRFVQTGGGAKTKAALLGKHINVGVLSASEAGPLAVSGDVRVLAVLGNDRLSQLPDVPTAKEQGVEAVLNIQHSLYFPKGTPQEAIDKVGGALAKVMANDELKATLAKRGILPTVSNAAQATASVDALLANLKVLAAGLK